MHEGERRDAARRIAREVDPDRAIATLFAPREARDDIHRVAYPVLNHRIILTPDKELEGVSTEDVIRQMLEKVEVPR